MLVAWTELLDEAEEELLAVVVALDEAGVEEVEEEDEADELELEDEAEELELEDEADEISLAPLTLVFLTAAPTELFM